MSAPVAPDRPEKVGGDFRGNAADRSYESVNDDGTTREIVKTEPRYDVQPLNLPVTVCLDCGVVVVDREAHTRFHSILSSHAWVLAVLKNTHLSERTHDRYDAAERIDRKRFDNWSADAIAEVAGLSSPRTGADSHDR